VSRLGVDEIGRRLKLEKERAQIAVPAELVV
jgi:hypothetical protein